MKNLILFSLLFLFGCGGPNPSKLIKVTPETRQRFELVDSQTLNEAYGHVWVTVFKDKDTNKHYLLTRTGNTLSVVEMRP